MMKFVLNTIININLFLSKILNILLKRQIIRTSKYVQIYKIKYLKLEKYENKEIFLDYEDDGEF